VVVGFGEDRSYCLVISWRKNELFSFIFILLNHFIETFCVFLIMMFYREMPV
jgi:hypothetical protein